MVGLYFYDTGEATNVTKGQFLWREYSPNSTADTSTTGKFEAYSLPEVTTGLTSNKTYNILTTKNAITVEQGGTGATTVDDARINLGVAPRDFYFYASKTTSTPAYATLDYDFNISDTKMIYGTLKVHSNSGPSALIPFSFVWDKDLANVQSPNYYDPMSSITSMSACVTAADSNGNQRIYLKV